MASGLFEQPFDLDGLLHAANELLRIRSTSDRPEDLRRAVDFVVDFAGSGFEVERFTAGGKPSALLYRGPVRPEFRVVLNGHVDVVPGADGQFEPRLDGDRLYARGAQDMKITALAQAYVFRELAARIPYPVALQVVADEEVGGREGTLHQLEQGVKAQFAVIGEVSGLGIVADSKGLAQARLIATGRGAHGAYPWLGENAVTKAMNSVARLCAAYPVPAGPEWRTTVNVARVETSNTAVNQVPADATVWLDIRFPAEDQEFGDKTAAQIQDVLQAYCEPGVSAEVVAVSAPMHTDHDHPDVLALRRAAQGEGYEAQFLFKHGSCDARHFAKFGMPAVSFGIAGDGQHGPDEYAEISSIEPYCRALAAFLMSLSA